MKSILLRQVIIMSRRAIYGVIFQCILYGAVMAENLNAQNIEKSIQEIYITIDVKNVPLKQVLNKIENKTGFTFAYNSQKVDLKRKYSLSFTNSDLATVLMQISKESDLKFKRINSYIHVGKRAGSESLQIEEKIMIQGITVTGSITSADDSEGLPGVNVVVKGTSQGSVTDVEGNYSLEVLAENAVLVFSSVGYVEEEITVGNQTIINLSMIPDITALEEIVVVGYGSVKKSDLTGSVASVSSEELTAYPAVDAIQALQGRAAGVTVTSTNGEPGSSYRVQIRGNTSITASNDPLYVVDGLVNGTIPPPEDIESIEILKDASATAIYGARGANGVVMVTTKRGKDGKTQINFSSSWSTQETINRLELLNANQYTSYIQEMDPTFTPELTGEGTDWQDELYRNGGIQNYQLSVAGSSDKVNYYLSGAYYDQDGVILNSDFSRFSITSNIDIKASKAFNFGASIFARGTVQSGQETQEGGDFNGGVVSNAYRFSPTQGIFDANGNYSVTERGLPLDNPVAKATDLQIETVNNILQSNVYAEINILDGLKFKTTLGLSTSNSRFGKFSPTTLVRGESSDGEATLAFSKRSSLITENYFTYSKTFADVHNLTVVAGYSWQKDRSERISAVASGFDSDSYSYWNLSAGSDPSVVNSRLVNEEYESFYARLNYTLNDKYLLTVTGRREGSSVFAKNNKYGFFPAAALGWKISNEDFMSNSSAISLLKLRASWGQVGNKAIDAYESQAFFGNTFATVQGSPVNAILVTQVANPDLTWETTTQTDIGIDLEVLDGRIGFTGDVYLMTTEDLLFSARLPGVGGVPTRVENIGTMENRGLELAINAGILQGELKWNSNANISFNKNEVIKLPENDTDGNDLFYSSSPLPGGGNTQLLREGLAVGAFWGYIYEGVSQVGDAILVGGEGEGGESFRDLNGDGELTDEDRAIIGDPNPDFTWGWNNDFSYKGFTLNIFIQGSQGGDMLNYTLMELGTLNGRSNATTDALNRWTTANTDTNIPRANALRGNVTSDRWISDASYIRVKNIALGYNFSSDLLSKIKLRSARIYISGQNLLTMTNYEGIDPEVAYRRGSALNQGLDYGSYPNVKSYTVGLNIGF